MFSSSGISDQFICPITHKIMKIPYDMPDGNTYDIQAIQDALQLKPKSPITGQSMRFEDGKINYCLLELINQYKQNLHNQQNFIVKQQTDSKITIYLRFFDGKLYIFHLLKSDTILTLKKEISKLFGIDVKDQMLSYCGKPLRNDYLTLNDYDFRDHSLVEYIIRMPGGNLNK